MKELGRQVYLGGYEQEAHAAEAYDVAALKCKGSSVKINFGMERFVISDPRGNGPTCKQPVELLRVTSCRLLVADDPAHDGCRTLQCMLSREAARTRIRHMLPTFAYKCKCSSQCHQQAEDILKSPGLHRCAQTSR